MIEMRILNERGHTTLSLTEEQVQDQIQDHPHHWVSINGEIISRKAITTVNCETVTSVDLIPEIVGGQ